MKAVQVMIISISSQKGGTGKTTTAISLSSGLARLQKKVLLIDIDSQANSSKVLLGDVYTSLTKEDTVYNTIIERQPLPIHNTTVANLDIVPAHILLSDTDIKLTTAIDHREARLKTQLEQTKSKYDYIFIDTPPSLSWLTINAFTASDKAIVIVSPGYFELDSTVQIIKSINDVKFNFNSELDLWGFLFTMWDTTLASKNSLSILRQTYLDKVFSTTINKNTDIKDAHMSKKDIFTYNDKARAALDYQRLIHELFKI